MCMLYHGKVISPNPTGCQGWEFGIAPSGEAADSVIACGSLEWGVQALQGQRWLLLMGLKQGWSKWGTLGEKFKKHSISGGWMTGESLLSFSVTSFLLPERQTWWLEPQQHYGPWGNLENGSHILNGVEREGTYLSTMWEKKKGSQISHCYFQLSLYEAEAKNS